MIRLVAAALALSLPLTAPTSRDRAGRPAARAPVGFDAAGRDRRCPDMVCAPGPPARDPMRAVADSAGRMLGRLRCRVPDASVGGSSRSPAVRLCIRAGAVVVCGAGAHSRGAGVSFGLSISGAPDAPACRQ